MIQQATDTKPTALFISRDSPAQSVTGPVTLKLQWDYPSKELDGVTFNVYHTLDLAQPFTLLTNVTDQALTISRDRAADFFTVKALRNGIESE